MEDAFVYEAFSSEYINNLLEQHKNKLPEATALHLTRNDDLLTLTLEDADMSVYQPHSIKGSCYDTSNS